MSTKKAPTKAEQAKAAEAEANAKAKAEEEAQAKLDAEKAEAEKADANAKAQAEKDAQAKADDEADVDTEIYYVQWTLHHDGKRFKAGDKLMLSYDDAEDLVEAGVLVAAK